MDKITLLKRYLLLFFSACLFTGRAGAQMRKFSFSQLKMGSPLNIILVTDDSTKAQNCAKSCFELVDSLNSIFSDYDTSAELSKLNTHAGSGAMAISGGLCDILLYAKDAFQKSGHSFDVTIGPLSQLWRRARKETLFPETADISAKLALIGFDKINFDPQKSTLALAPGFRLDLGGIAKGYTAQKIVDYLLSRGITQSLADAGGDMAMTDAPPGSGGWVIGINLPETADDLLPKKLLLKNKAVATSGDVYQYFAHEGKRYSHIIDPRTGYGITSQRNVTVIADNGTLADWLATSCSILPINEAKKLAIAMKAELLIAEMKEAKIVFHATPGFKKFWKKN
ncbi:MAG: hypothetical protein RLZZ28_2525 [Bacteroidota bacterium]